MPDGNSEISDIEARFQCLHQFVPAARKNLDDGAWDYLFGGAETETTQRRNRHALDRLAFRPRVMRDVTGLDASTDFLGRKLRLPIILAPIGSLQQFSAEGGSGVSKAAGEFGVAAQDLRALALEPSCARSRASDQSQLRPVTGTALDWSLQEAALVEELRGRLANGPSAADCHAFDRGTARRDRSRC